MPRETKAAIGATVVFCGHDLVFTADIYQVENAVVVRATGPVMEVGRRGKDFVEKATHHIHDFPTRGFWRPDLGVMVVPQKQLRVLKK